MTALDFTAAGSAHPPRATQYRAAGALAYLRRQTKRRRADDAEGHLLYLLRTGVVVVPEHRLDGAWSCILIADPTRPPAHTGLDVTDVDIETALNVVQRDPLADLDTATYTTIWQTRIWDRWPGGHPPQLARVLASLIQPPTCSVELKDDAVRAILRQVHLMPAGLRQLLARLGDAGLLQPTSPSFSNRWGSYTLTLPAHRSTRESGPRQA